MENFDPNFIDNAWQNMQQQLDVAMPQKKKRRSLWVYFTVAAAFILAVATAFLYLPNPLSSSTQLANQASQNTTDCAGDIVQKQSEITTTNNKQNAAESKFKMSDFLNLEKCSHRNQDQASTQKNVQTKSKNNIVNKLNINKNIINNIDNQYVAHDNLFSSIEKPNAYLSNIAANNDGNKEDKKSLITEVETKNVIENPLNNVEKIEATKPLFSDLKLLNFDQSYVLDLPYLNINRTLKNTQKQRFGFDIYANSTTARKAIDGFNIGAVATYKLNSKWKLSTGLQYQHHSLYFTKNINSGSYSYDNSGKFNTGNSVPGTNYPQITVVESNNEILLSTKVNRYSVPLLISYHTKHRFGIQAGLNFNFTQDVISYFANNKPTLEALSTPIKYQFTQSLIVGLQYDIHKKLTLESGVQFDNNIFKNLNSSNSFSNGLLDTTEPTTQPKHYHFFYLGLRYKLK